MTVVSSKEFVSNEDKYFDLALDERVFVKRGKNMFHLICGNNEDDYDNLIESKAFADDEDTNCVNIKKYVKNDPFAEVFGMWANRDIDAKTLRKQAWRIEN